MSKLITCGGDQAQDRALRAPGLKPASPYLPDSLVIKQAIRWDGFQVCAVMWRLEKRRKWLKSFDNIFLQIACLDPDLSGEETQTIANHSETSRSSIRALGRNTDGLEPVCEPVNRSSSTHSTT